MHTIDEKSLPSHQEEDIYNVILYFLFVTTPNESVDMYIYYNY